MKTRPGGTQTPPEEMQKRNSSRILHVRVRLLIVMGEMAHIQKAANAAE